jgi:hypothetical protein
MQFPLFLARVDVGKVEQLREEPEAVFDEVIGCLSDVNFDVLGDLMEMVEFVSDHADQISY